MKNVIIVLGIFLCMSIASSNAQKIIEKHFIFSSKKSLILNITSSDSIKIVAWDKSEVYLKAVIDTNFNANNDIYTTTFLDSRNVLEVNAKFPDYYSEVCNTRIIWQIFVPESVVFSLNLENKNMMIVGATTIDSLGNPQQIINEITTTYSPCNHKVHTDWKFSTSDSTKLSVEAKKGDIIAKNGKSKMEIAFDVNKNMITTESISSPGLPEESRQYAKLSK